MYNEVIQVHALYEHITCSYLNNDNIGYTAEKTGCTQDCPWVLLEQHYYDFSKSASPRK